VLRGSIPNEVPHESFDLIGLFDVLEHLEHPVAALRVFRERLTREGRLVITVPAFPFLWSKHDELNHHFRRYTVRSLTGELAAAGFEIEFHTHYNIPLFAPIAMVRLFRKLIPGDETGSDFASSEGVLNRALAAVFQAERHLVSRLQFPFGVSLLALARPKA
jgi:SAM-dependent methyltransferase